MNNGKSNTRGSGKGRVVAYLLLAVFCVAIFAPTVTAGSTDPNRIFPHIDNVSIKTEYDDGGFNDQDASPGWSGRKLLGCYDIRVTAPTLFLYFFDLLDVPDSPNQGNGNDRQDLDHDRTTSPQ